MLYKYMSFIDHLLILPTIKLSPPCLLNDPFEQHSSDDYKKLVYKCYLSDGSPPLNYKHKKNQKKFEQEIIQNQPSNIAGRTGIVSLSESSRSLLMWAHYADQHKGIVVGFDDDFLSDIETDALTQEKLIHTKKPIKISYDTTRFDPFEYENENGDFRGISKKLAMKLLTTKSDDWIYEKEHRYIIPIAVADKIKYLGGDNKATEDLINVDGQKRISIHAETKNVKVNSDILMTDNLYMTMSKNSNFLFLKKIDPKKIKAIFFGFRTPRENISRYVWDIEKNLATLGHIELFKYKLCDTDFKLVKERIKKSEYIL